MGYPVKVTYAKSSKKGAKRYTKNYSTVITVKNPSLSVKAAATTLTVGETAKLTVKKTPSSATVKYSSSDDAVASVANGVISANGVGTAVITTKLTCGTKTISKNITVKVTEAVNDGISVSLQNQYSPDYKDVVVSNYDINKDKKAIVRLYYGKNNKGVNNETLHIRYTSNGGNTYQTAYARTDVNGVAYWELGCADGAVTKISYTITPESNSALAKEGSFSFASIEFQDVVNVNGKDGKPGNQARSNDTTDYKAKGYAGLVVSTNDVKGSSAVVPVTKTAGTYTQEKNGVATSAPQYKTSYVNSQQVDHKVGFVGGVPTITLPGENDTLNQAEKFEQPVDLTSGDYGTYASDSKYITLNVDPTELTYATMNFTSLKLSKYTKLTIDAFKTEEDAKSGDVNKRIGGAANFQEIKGPHDQSNFSYQIPLNDTSATTMCIRVTLESKGQVNTDTNKGYVIKDITGVYKNKKTVSGKTEPLKGAKITWAATTAKYSNEKEIAYSAINSRLADNTLTYAAGKTTDEATGKEVKKLTYSVPVFPYTGNAVIKAYDANGKVIAYFACPTVNKETVIGYANENVLNVSQYDLNGKYASYIYRISEEEATQSVGTVTENDGIVTVESSKAGTTVIAGTVSGVPGLDASNDTIYTSVQWNPIAKTTDANSGAIAFAGQEVSLTAQLVDKNQNPVASVGKGIEFAYTANTKVSELIKESNTDSKGQAKLVVCAAENTVLTNIEAKSKDSAYDAVLLVNGKQVKKLDLYWIEAQSQFTPSSVAGAADEDTTDYKASTTPVVSGKAKPTIGDNWQYGFTIAKEKLANDGTWKNKEVTIKNAKIAITHEGGTYATVKEAGNGSVYVTSTAPKAVTLSAIVDGSAFDNNGVTFDVKDVGETKSVGEGSTSFKNEQKLVIDWQGDGLKGGFVQDLGFNAVSGSSIDLYFKATDKLGNPLSGKTINTQIGTTTGTATTDANGLAKITVNHALYPGYKTVVSATFDNVVYRQIITWTNGAALVVDPEATVNGGAATSANPRTTYADAKKIVLTFNDNILASSVKVDQFTVYRGTDGTNKQAIGSVTVSGKTITITFRDPITDNAVQDFFVHISSATIDGVPYQVTSSNGAIYSAGTINNIKAQY